MLHVVRKCAKLTKVSSADLKAFGVAVKRARSLKPWTLDKLGAAFDPPMGKSLISKVENGRKGSLGVLTVGRFIKALDMDETWIDKFLGVETTEDGDETKAEQDADLIMERAKREKVTEGASEDLIILLANQHAEGTYIDRETAYIGLRNALMAFGEMKAQSKIRGSADDQFQDVMARVAELNDLGELEDASALLEEEAKRMRQSHKVVEERHQEDWRQMVQQQLRQDRLNDDPAAAADRLIRDLIRHAPAGGVFWATSDLINEWRKRGEKQGDPFDLRVALVLANRNLKRSKRHQKGQALLSLGNCRLSIGERRVDPAFVIAAEKAMRAALEIASKLNDKPNMAICQSNVGTILQDLGVRQSDPDLLRNAIALHRSAINLIIPNEDWNSQNSLATALRELGELEQETSLLQESLSIHLELLSRQPKDKYPDRWAGTKLNLAIVKRSLGRLSKDVTSLDEAQSDYEGALTIQAPETAPYSWANLVGGLGELALDRFALDQDARHLDEAEKRLNDAKAVMAKSHEPLSERCDALLAKIAAARNAA